MIKIIEFIQNLFWEDRTFGAARSPKWSQIRNSYLKENPLCAVCGKKGKFLSPNEIHHCFPFHIYPTEELNPKNFITLCKPHHLLFGHFMNWASFNLKIREDAENWQKRIKERP